MTAILFSTLFISVNAGLASAKARKDNPRYAAIVMDAQTGEIISQSNADKPLHPASLTKAMTLLMMFDALEQGKLSMNDRITISRHAYGMAPSKLGIKAGGTIRVKDAISALITKSANDIAAAVAEHLEGTESRFAQKMTQRAHGIGMNKTVFVNASGLHNPRQLSTARDMAIMARYIIKNYPGYYRLFSMDSFTYQGRTYRNHNHLMETYKGMDGIKTGYVAASGFNLVASAVRGDRRLIGVVFGGRTTKSRNDQMASLLDNGFNKLRKMPEKMPEKMYVAQAHNAPTNKSLKQNNTIPASLVTNAINPKSTPEKTLKTQNLTLSAKQSNVSAELEESSGQGDSETATDESIADAGISRRIETGLMAIAAHQSRPTLHQIHLRQDHKVKTIAQYKQEQQPKVMEASYSPQPSSGLWSVQIGAYSSRAASDQSIHNAMKHLPASYANARPLIAPLKTNDGWIFRARLAGFTRSEAMAACHYLKDCLPLAPQN